MCQILMYAGPNLIISVHVPVRNSARQLKSQGRQKNKILKRSLAVEYL